MSVKRFLEYAGAFERAYASDDWSLIAEFFSEEATYRVVGPDRLAPQLSGRPAVLDYFRWITTTFDKRCEERKLVPIEAPVEKDGRVVLHGAAVYRMKDGERCHVILTETAWFEGDQIRQLVDELTPGTVHELQLWLDRYPDVFPRSFARPEP